MEKESIKAAINILLSSRKAQQSLDGGNQKLPGLEPENTGIDSNNNTGPVSSGPVIVKLPAVGSNEQSDSSANTPLFKPGITNAEIASNAIIMNSVDINKVFNQIANLINSTLTSSGYKPGQQVTAEQENVYATNISNALGNYLSSSNFGDSVSLLAGNK